jgi:hypothetical protein
MAGKTSKKSAKAAKKAAIEGDGNRGSLGGTDIRRQDMNRVKDVKRIREIPKAEETGGAQEFLELPTKASQASQKG